MAGRFSLRRRGPNADRSPINPCLKYFLFLTNFVFLLVGLGAAAAGTYVLVLKEKVVRSAIDFFFDPSCLMCLGGCIALVLAFLGCWGSLRENVPVIKAYYYLVCIFLFMEIAFIIFVFIFYYVPESRNALNLYPDEALKDAIRKYRDDQDTQNFIDKIQELLQCCGVSNDEEGYLDWNTNLYFNCTTENPSTERCAVPWSCCRLSVGDEVNLLCGRGALNKIDPPKELTKKIYTQGCLRGVQTFLDGSALIVGGVTIAILLPQAVFVFLARSLSDQILEQMAKWRYQ